MSGARNVDVEALSVCPFSVAQGYAEDFLRDVLPALLRQRVSLTFGVHDDIAERGRRHDELRVQWRAGTALLPAFRGTVRFRIAGANTRVLVAVSYRAPFGIFGRAFDRLVGGRLAQAGAFNVAGRLAAYLEARQSAWRASVLLPAPE